MSAIPYDPRLNQVSFAIEVDPFSYQALWVKYAMASNESIPRAIDWQEVHNGGGPLYEVGRLANHPVVIALRFVELQGTPVVFYWTTSQVVHWGMIEEWLENNVPCYRAGNKAAADDFYRCLNYVTGS